MVLGSLTEHTLLSSCVGSSKSAKQSRTQEKQKMQGIQKHRKNTKQTATTSHSHELTIRCLYIYSATCRQRPPGEPRESPGGAQEDSEEARGGPGPRRAPEEPRESPRRALGGLQEGPRRAKPPGGLRKSSGKPCKTPCGTPWAPLRGSLDPCGKFAHESARACAGLRGPPF